MNKKEILLLSYPRSGNTFTRYILESLYDIKTTGYSNSSDIEKGVINKKKNKESLLSVTKRHGHKKILSDEIKNNKYNSFIFLIRNPINVFLRHESQKEFNNFLLGKTEKFEYFFKNIETYNLFKEDKTIVTYEKMVNNPNEYIKDLVRFINMDNSLKTTVEEFIFDYDFHFKRSFKIYGNSRSSGKVVKEYKNVLSLTSKEIFWKVFFDKLSLIENLDSKMMKILLEYKKLDEKEQP